MNINLVKDIMNVISWEHFLTDMAGANEVVGCEFKQINEMHIMDESAPVTLFNEERITF